MFNRIIVTISSLVLLVTISGCGEAKMYSGPKRDKSELAFIQTQDWKDMTRTPSMEMEIISIKVEHEGYRKPNFSAVWVLPGTHTVSFAWYGYVEGERKRGEATFKLTVAAGRKYVLRADPTQGGEDEALFWIEELETRARVGRPVKFTESTDPMGKHSSRYR